jgi:DNA invertase Pin-like site-specific DNA recombinase
MASYRTAAARAAVSTTCPSSRAPKTLPAAPPAPAAGALSLKRAALYARVSTEKQAREDTVASQVDLLYKAAAASGYDIAPTSVFIDEDVSGTRLDRPALDRLRDLAAEGVCEVLLVTVPDRLARRYAYQVLLVEEFHRCGCEVVFVQHSLGASPEAQMLVQMQGVFAEYERALIQERTRRGRLFAARQGRVNWGNPPYGYTYVRKTLTTPQHLVINEAEAEVVRLIYRWCVEEQLRWLCRKFGMSALRGEFLPVSEALMRPGRRIVRPRQDSPLSLPQAALCAAYVSAQYRLRWTARRQTL